MVNIDSLVRLIKSKTGVQETCVATDYICDVLREDEDIRNLISEKVMIAMTENEEFINESPQEKRERLERIERG